MRSLSFVGLSIGLIIGVGFFLFYLGGIIWLTAEGNALRHPLALVADPARRSQQLEAALTAVGGHRSLGEIRAGEDHAAVRRWTREAAAGIWKGEGNKEEIRWCFQELWEKATDLLII